MSQDPFVGKVIDGRYEIQPGLGFFCPRGGNIVLANTGTVTAAARRKLLLIPDDLDGLEACVGNGAKYSSWVRPSPDETLLTGRTTLRGRVTQSTNVGPASTRR